MTSQDLKPLLDYHYWARDRVLAALEPLTSEQYTRDLGSSFRSVRDTVVHIYSADWIWLQRWRASRRPRASRNVSGSADCAMLGRRSKAGSGSTWRP
jgi:uncharacterized damage-inducible protein DinB